jgi:hypothetical protein
MRLLDSLRNAQKKGRTSVRERVEHAREEWNDVERRIRQRMRVYPEKLRAKLGFRPEPEPEEDQNLGLAAGAAAGTGNNQPVKPIVSIRGRDVPPEDIDDSAA